MKVIALMAPKARSGKTTFATALVENMKAEGLMVAQIAFANDLKTQCVNRLSDSRDVRNMLRDIDQTDAKDAPLRSLSIDKVHDVEYRKFLMNRYVGHDAPRSWRWHCTQFGTAFMRVHKEDQLVWIRKVFDKILALNAQGYDYVIIDDLRTEAEASALKMLNACFIEINRGQVDITQPVESTYSGLAQCVGSDVWQLYFNDVKHNQSAAKAWAVKFKVDNE